jgi:hypothetical protein
VRACPAYGLVLSLTVAACGSGAPADEIDATVPFDAGGVPARLEVGTGTATFRALAASGGTIELVHGPQGGYHVDVAARLYGLDPEGLVLRYETRCMRDDALLAFSEIGLRRSLVVPEGDHFVHVGARTVFDTTDPAPFVGLAVRVLAIATPASGGPPVTDERAVLVVDAME